MPGRESAATAGTGLAIQGSTLTGYIEVAAPLTGPDIEGKHKASRVRRAELPLLITGRNAPNSCAARVEIVTSASYNDRPPNNINRGTT